MLAEIDKIWNIEYTFASLCDKKNKLPPIPTTFFLLARSRSDDHLIRTASKKDDTNLMGLYKNRIRSTGTIIFAKLSVSERLIIDACGVPTRFSGAVRITLECGTTGILLLSDWWAIDNMFMDDHEIRDMLFRIERSAHVETTIDA